MRRIRKPDVRTFLWLQLSVIILMILEFSVLRDSMTSSKSRKSTTEYGLGGKARLLRSEQVQGAIPGVFRQGVYEFGRGKLIVCKIEKVATRVVLELGARVDGVENWHSNQLADVLAYAKTKTSVTSAQLLDGKIPKVVMVRDPATRLLSAYISKIEDKGWPYASSYAPNCPEETTSFEQLIGVLEGASDMMQVNRHFRPQNLFCGFQHGVKYDCIIKYEDRANGWKSCLMKLGLWDEFGSSGWGPKEIDAIFNVHENFLNGDRPKVYTVTVSPSLFDEYYTPELLERVFNLYKQDYQFFGLPKSSLAPTAIV